jgi:hypothetical protein
MKNEELFLEINFENLFFTLMIFFKMIFLKTNITICILLYIFRTT